MKYGEKLAKPDKTIKQHTDELLVQLDLLKDYGYIKDNHIYMLAKEACINHDIGKVNDYFQKRVNSENGKKLKFNLDKEVPHNILSGFMMSQEDFDNEKDYAIVLHAVINHHNYVDVCDYVYDDKYEELIEHTLDGLGFDVDIIDVRDKFIENIEDNDAILVKGYLHKCDYSASAGYDCEYKNDFLEENLSKFLQRMKDKNITNNWNPMQKYCLENKDNNIIVVAQTGMGKTEGALNWIGDNKGYFILPLRTAINAMYKRISNDIIESKNINDINKKVSILHSASLEYYIQQFENISDNEFYEIEEYEKEGKQWSIPLNITTMDQLFDFVFKYQGYELKLTTLSYSKIVVDEIQMYDPALLAYLIYGLQRISKLGGRIAIVTATLPPFINDLLIENINFKEKVEFVNDEIKRHNVEVIENKISAIDILNKYTLNEEEGNSNKILVICNTVKKAQQLYLELKDMLEEEGLEESLHILHSRFIRSERKNLEDEIKDFGKTYSDDKNKIIDKASGIWISTSLVEASLDIDFDYLFTELQDLNSLFQRFGRCNRKGVKDNSKTNCFVYTEIDKEIIKRGNKGFIDKTMYELSKKALSNVNGLINESEKLRLINELFTTEQLKDSDYLKSYRKAYNKIRDIIPYKFDKSDIQLREIYSEDIIPKPIYDKYFDEIDKLESLLSDRNLDRAEKIKNKEKLMSYTVSIPGYEVEKYKKAVIKNKAELCSDIRINNREKIKVIDCNYDEKGFFSKEYTIQSGEGEFL